MDSKKSDEANLEKRRSTFLVAGFLTSLAIVLMAFEWTVYEKEKIKEQKLDLDLMQQEKVPPSQPEKPKPKPKKTTQIEVVEEEEDIEDELNVSDMEIDESSEIDFDGAEEEENVKEEKVFSVVEEMPKFPGGKQKMFKYLGEHIQYPSKAKDAGVTGTVYVSFTVEKDGSITNVKVLRGIGAGCDEEAKRVVRNMPNWKPGEQRGKKVRVNYKLPVKFQLN